MGQVRQDNVQIKLEIDGSQSRTELDNLTRKAQVLQDGLKGLKKGSEEYVAANKELSQVNARMKELREEIGLTSLTTGQLRAMSSQLNRELAQLTPNTESFRAKAQQLAEVDARLAQVRAEAKGVSDELSNAGGGVGEFIKKAIGFAGIQLGVQAVVGQLKQLGTESVAEFEQAQGAAAQLQAALTSTGNAAGLTKQELLDLSTALEGKTILDGDAITQAQSVLLTFTKIKKGVYEEALPAIVDMATRLGGDGPADLQGATIQVGKALNDPLKGITALAKAGVSFSEDQKTVIKSLVETGDVAGAQKLILQELTTEFGGSAEAAAKAGTGPLKQFEVQIGNVKEGLGELIVDGLRAIQPALSAGLQLLALFIEALKATPAFLSENRGLLMGLAVALLTLNASNIAATASALYFAAVEKGRAIATTASAVAQRLLNAAMTANPIGLVIAAVALLVGGLVTLYERSEKVREVFAGLGAAAMQVFKNIKDAVLLQLGGVADLLTGIFTFDLDKIKAGVVKLGEGLKKQYGGLGDGVAGAYHQGYGEREQVEQAAQAVRDKQAQAEKVQRAKEAAAKTAAEVKAANLESLKDREANIKAALALVATGSAEELRLKKLEVATKRDIDLLDEKKTAGDKKVIRAEALRDLHQLQEEYDKKQTEAAAKHAKEQADVEKKIADLKAGLLGDETAKRIQQLAAAAEQEKATAKGTAEQIAEQRQLIDQKLAVDTAEVRRAAAQKAGLAELEVEKLNNSLIRNEFDRKDAEINTTAKEAKAKLLVTDVNYAAKVKAIDDKALQDHKANDDARAAHHKSIEESIAVVEEDIELKRIARRRQQGKEREQDSAREIAILEARLQRGHEAEILDLEKLHDEKSISDEEYLLRKKRADDEYRGAKEELDSQAEDRQREREKASIDLRLEQVATLLQTVADFEKIASDKELSKLEKDKKARLAKVEAEYKAGKISKEQYEASKSAIEADYDQKTRQIKKQAAEKEKEFNVAQAVIQTALSVLKASPSIPLMIAAGITGAAGIAKIIATPIPEFEKGGFFSRVGQGVKHYASGGRINARAGVADVGQRHSSGGIRMVDGATGEHLGEWERGEAYMILSRDTYANNKHLVDELIDTSLYRGGASVRQRPGFYEDGGTFSPSTAAPSAANTQAASQELVQLLRETRDAVRSLPNRQYISWDQDDTAAVEQLLEERIADRRNGAIR